MTFTTWDDEHKARHWGVWPAEYMVRAVKAFPREHGRSYSALDIGAGGGAHVRLLLSEGFNTTAQDISPTAISRIQEPINKRCGDINAMEFETGQFDLIIDNLTLTHVEHPDWELIWSWLKPGGRLITAQFYMSDESFPPNWCRLEDLPKEAIHLGGERIENSRYRDGIQKLAYAIMVCAAGKPK